MTVTKDCYVGFVDNVGAAAAAAADKRLQLPKFERSFDSFVKCISQMCPEFARHVANFPPYRHRSLQQNMHFVAFSAFGGI